MRESGTRLWTGIEICDRNQDTPTANILQDLLDKTEKRIWFLFEAAQDDRRRE